MPGVSGYVFVSADRPALWSPAVFVGGTHAWTTDLVELGGRAAFTLDAVSLDACALHAQASIFDGRACVTGLLGRLMASGSATQAPATVPRPFAFAGLATIGALHLGPVLELSARVAAGVTLVRDSFEFGPVVFYRAAPLTLAASLGVGAGWP
jgi:hypothetical protein